MSGMLQYIPGDSVMHRMYPTVKLALAVMISLSCFISGDHGFILGMIGLSLLIGAVGGIGKQTLRTAQGLAKLGLLLFGMQVLFVRQGTPLVTLPMGVALTDAGVRFSSLISLRLMGATLPLSVILALTPITGVTHALTEDLRVPYRYAFALTTAIRFIPLLSGEMRDIIEAQTSRGLELDGHVAKRISLMVPLCVPMLVSAVKRVENSATAAELRGFHLRARHTQYRRYRLGLPDVAAMLLCLALPTMGALL